MQLSSLSIKNFLGVKDLETDLGPSVLVCGPNASGKTSVRQAIALSLTGTFPRVDLKKELGALVHEDADEAIVQIGVGDETNMFRIKNTGQTSGLQSGVNAPLSRQYLIDAHLFATDDNNRRRQYLFGLSGLKVKPDEVKQILVEREECQENLVDEIIPFLKSGFPAACTGADDKAKEARGSWRAITGSPYGKDKAAMWKAKAVRDDDTTDEAIKEWEQEANRLDERRKALKVAEKSVSDFKKQVSDMEEERRKCLPEKEDQTGERPQLACPECGAALKMLVGYKLGPWNHKELDPGDPKRVKEIDEILPEYKKALEALVEAKTNWADGVETSIMAQGCLNGLNKADTKAAEKKAKDLTEQASQYHFQCEAWLKIRDMLAPDGIMQEMLETAFMPLNEILSTSAKVMGWPETQIETTTTTKITFGGRPYRMISESEQWQADAMLCQMIAEVSGEKFMMLDRLDVLEPAKRPAMIDWATDVLGPDGYQTIMFSTLKGAPSPEALPKTQLIWLGE